MKQYEAVIQALRNKGGYAPLGELYEETLKIPDVIWGTKTPFASIRKIVQIREEIFRIRPGIWGLKSIEIRYPKNFLMILRWIMINIFNIPF